MLSSGSFNQTLPFSRCQSHYRASTQHQPQQCCLQAVQPGKGLPSPTTPAHATSPGCREASSTCPFPSTAMQPNIQFSWSKTHERPQPSSGTQPPPRQFTQDHPGAVQMHQWTRELAIPWLWEGMYHHHIHRPSNLQLTFGSTTKPQARELDQTGPKPSNPVPATRQVCK